MSRSLDSSDRLALAVWCRRGRRVTRFRRCRRRDRRQRRQLETRRCRRRHRPGYSLARCRSVLVRATRPGRRSRRYLGRRRRRRCRLGVGYWLGSASGIRPGFAARGCRSGRVVVAVLVIQCLGLFGIWRRVGDGALVVATAATTTATAATATRRRVLVVARRLVVSGRGLGDRLGRLDGFDRFGTRVLGTCRHRYRRARLRCGSRPRSALCLAGRCSLLRLAFGAALPIGSSLLLTFLFGTGLAFGRCLAGIALTWVAALLRSALGVARVVIFAARLARGGCVGPLAAFVDARTPVAVSVAGVALLGGLFGFLGR